MKHMVPVQILSIGAQEYKIKQWLKMEAGQRKRILLLFKSVTNFRRERSQSRLSFFFNSRLVKTLCLFENWRIFREVFLLGFTQLHFIYLATDLRHTRSLLLSKSAYNSRSTICLYHHHLFMCSCYYDECINVILLIFNFYKVYLDEIAVKQESWQLHRYLVIFLSTLHQLSACLTVCSKKVLYSVVLLVYVRCKYFKLIGIYIVVGLA